MLIYLAITIVIVFLSLLLLPKRKLKILIITAENRIDDYITHHDVNFSKYARKHEYTYSRLDNCPISESSTYWCKIHKVKQGLATNKYDYVMWCDSDTIFTNQHETLEHHIRKNGSPDVMIGRDKPYNDENLKINAGVFLIKNSRIGKSFIDDCLNEINSKPWCIVNGKEQGKWAGECYEQGVMNKLVVSNKYKNNVFIDHEHSFILTHITVSLFSMETKMPLIVHLATHTPAYRELFFRVYI